MKGNMTLSVEKDKEDELTFVVYLRINPHERVRAESKSSFNNALKKLSNSIKQNNGY